MKKFLIALMVLLAISLVGCTQAVTPPLEVKPEEPTVEVEAPVNETEEPAAPLVEPVAEELTYYQQMRKDIFDQLVGWQEPDKAYRIGAVLITQSNPFWTSLKQGYEDAALELGVSVDALAGTTEGDVNSQLATCESMVANRYDAVVVHTITAVNNVPCIVKGTEEGVIMVDPDGRIDKAAVAEAGGDIVGTILEIYEVQGSTGAQGIIDALGEEGGKVAIIEGLAGAPQSEGRKNGAKGAFETAKNIEIVSIQSGEWDRAKALAITENVLQANPDLRGIYCANDVMALAAVEAVEAAGLHGQVLVVGTDYIADAATAIKNGTLFGSVAFSGYVRGELSLKLGIMAAMGLPLPEKVEMTPFLVTSGNVDLLSDWK